MKRIRRLNLLANSVAGKELLCNSDLYAEKEEYITLIMNGNNN